VRHAYVNVQAPAEGTTTSQLPKTSIRYLIFVSETPNWVLSFQLCWWVWFWGVFYLTRRGVVTLTRMRSSARSRSSCLILPPRTIRALCYASFDGYSIQKSLSLSSSRRFRIQADYHSVFFAWYYTSFVLVVQSSDGVYALSKLCRI